MDADTDSKNYNHDLHATWGHRNVHHEMSKPTSQANAIECVLCSATAAAQQVDLRRAHVCCPQCGEYVVSSLAAQTLARSASTTRERFAKEVKSTTDPNYIYVILGPQPDAVPETTLEGSSQLREDALRRDFKHPRTGEA